MFKRFGPGAMVAAAFIGPGTVTTATAAGAQFGVALIWAVVFSVVATVVLQELSLRAALVTDRDLAGLMRSLGAGRWWGWLLLTLIILAIGVGNAAYQSGNLAGAGLGLQALLGGDHQRWITATALLAGGIIVLNRYDWFERVLVTLVALMAVVFVGLATVLLLADSGALAWSPALPANSGTLTLALIGTTVVPYNLFLHASAAKMRWRGEPIATSLAQARFESVLSISIGGAVTLAIVIVGAVLLSPDRGDQVLAQLVLAVDDTLPGFGRWLIGSGLFAAGLTSAVAAPIAAGWAVCGCFGWPVDRQSRSFRAVALFVLVCGVVFSLLTARPIALILTAQATNAVLLPIVAIALLAVVNRKDLLGNYVNTPLQNLWVGLIMVFILGLAVTKLSGLF
jgi:manganese transport protein